ncbi:MAG: response regulator [Campylobacteraceae bacterium]|jgi:signal transduction histidine kinase/DNA-binding response OmpR family regulator|nr:response regulator [Campylobacteraceae bacterium]
MRLFAHKYKNIRHLQKFCEENIQEHTYASLLALVAYKNGSKKEADEVGDFIQKTNKKAIVISFGIEAGCIGERLVDKGVFVTFLMTKKASIKAKAIESLEITDDFLSEYKNEELKALLLFSSMPHLLPKELRIALASLNTKIAGVKSYAESFKAPVKLNSKEIKSGLVVVMLSGKNLEVNIYKNSEIKPISKKLQVTNVKEGFVYEIEEIKLLEAYKKLLGEDIVVEDPLLAACRFPLISQSTGKALFIDEFNFKKAVMCGDIKSGDMVQIGYSSLKNISSESYESAKEVRAKSLSAMLIFSDYTLKKIFKNKTPLAIPGSLASLCKSASYFGDIEIYADKENEPEELSHSSIIITFSEKEDKPNDSHLKEIKVPLTPADAFVNLVDDALKEQIEINAKLKKALSTQKIFISSISHDIRTPLNSIIGFLELLECTDLDTEQQSYVQRSLVSSKHLLRLISDVLDVSKIEAGQMEFFESQFDYGLLLEEIKNIVSSRCENEVSLEFIDPKIDRYLIGDADRIKQILVNLITNALKFTKHGYVKIVTTTKERSKHKIELEIVVEDTGIGIEKSKLNEIFKPFYQTRETVSKNFSGTGLGLYICKNICEIMGGSIRCESKLGDGSKFFVTLPLKLGRKIDKNQGKLELKYDFSTNAFKDLKLLIAEDVAFNAELISAMLDKKFGIKNIKFAKDGLEALEIVRKESFDMVFVDIQMPRLDGFSMIRLMREFDKTTPVVVMSANAFKEDMAKALKLGANDYITKPVRADKVAEALGKYAAKCQNNGSCDIIVQKHDQTKINMQRQMFAYYKNNLGLTGKDAKTLYGVCVDSIKKTITKAEAALEQNDFGELYGAIHNLKGILASTGLDEQLHTANTLNTKAKNAAGGAKDAIDDEFRESFSRLKNALFMLYEG